MSTETPETFETAIGTIAVLPSVTDLLPATLNEASLARMRDEYSTLVVRSPDDKVVIAAVARARLECKNVRCEIESQRKTLKQPLLDRGKLIDTEAKRLTAIVEPTEKHLIQEEIKVDNWEAARIKEEERKAAAEAKRLADEAAAKLKAEQEARAAELRKQEAELAKQREEMAAEQRRVAAEQKAAQDKIDAERKKLEDAQRIERERQAAEQKKIDDARRAAEAEKVRLERVEANRLAAEKQREEAAARAQREAEERVVCEAKAKEEAEAAKARAEAMRPDREKLLAVSKRVAEIGMPTMATTEGQAVAARVNETINQAAEIIRNVVNKFMPEPQAASAESDPISTGADADLADMI